MNVPINVIYSEVISNKEAYSKWLSSRMEGYQTYRGKWASNPQNFIVEPFPLNLDIEPTNRCNLRCPFCYRTIALKNSPGGKQDTGLGELGDMKMETFERIISQITVDGKIQVPAIKLTHRGEPLLNKLLCEFVRMAKDYGAIDVIVNTNATLLTEDMAEKLCLAGLDKLLISIDAPDKRLYESLRVGAVFEEVINNAKNAVQVRNKLNADMLIRAGMVITKQTAPFVDDFLNMFSEISDVVSFNKVHEEIEIDEDGNFNKEGHCGNVKSIPFADSQLWQRMTINWNGETEICCENYKSEYKLKNIFESKVSEIWTGDEFRRVREAHQKGEWWKVPQCRKCTIPHMR